MSNLPPFFTRLRQVAQRKTFRYAMMLVSMTNFTSFMQLLTCDCFHWWRIEPGKLHTLAAVALAVSSYLWWMLLTFVTVGYFSSLWSGRASGQTPAEKKYLLTRVRAFGAPPLYAVYAIWGYVSITGPAAWLGRLSLSLFVTYDIAVLLANWADKKPRPPKRRLPQQQLIAQN